MAANSRLPPMLAIRDLIKLYGLSARAQLSQNFLLDLHVTDRIVRHAGDLSNAAVVEVGPGPGSLTRSLLAAGARVVLAVEKDERFAPTLAMLADASEGRLLVAQGDILKVSAQSIVDAFAEYCGDNMPSRIHLIGNLPFNVATPLFINWLHDIAHRRGLFSPGLPPVSMTLMFQKEVAERIVAPPNTEHRGRLSAMSQRICAARIMMTLQGKAFVPAPKVAASVVNIEPLAEPVPVQSPDVYEDVLRHCFHLKRKGLRHSLGAAGPQYVACLGQLGISPLTRPESLTEAQWARLADECLRLGWQVQTTRRKREQWGSGHM